MTSWNGSAGQPMVGAGVIDGDRSGARVAWALGGGVLLLAAALALAIFPTPVHSQILALGASLLLGAPLVLRGAREVMRGQPRMGALVALAVLAAFVSGKYLECGAIAFFMVLSLLIESRTALGARRSIESLVRITPTRASRLEADGRETTVEASALRAGDVVRVRPGDNIPADGVVVSGQGAVDQSNITGESLPADKGVGDEAFAGSINLTGLLDIQVTKAGADTTLGRVQELILKARGAKTPIVRATERYAAWYAPTVLMLAGVVFAFTHNMDRVVAMFVIACPVAVILATPTAMVAALSAAARLGVLVKNGADLEVARGLTAIVFDKTGTLTTGQLSVSRLFPAEGVDPVELLLVAASVEQNSRHPVARAVVAVARQANLALMAPVDFQETPGRGVAGKLEGQPALVGRESYLAQQGLDVSGLPVDEAEGLSLLYVARGGRVLGWIGLEDRARPDAARAMDEVREQGVKTLVMVTGDRWSVARRVAAQLHCNLVWAEVLPEQKLQLVDDLKRQGHVVAVVGDGVNDAPALAAGHISIAMGAAGSDVALHSASIALMNNNLNRIPFLLGLSRRLNRVVGQNLTGSVAYVVVLLALSAAGWVPPLVAAVAQVVGALLVTLNSARLVREGENLGDVTPVVAPKAESHSPELPGGPMAVEAV